MGRVVSYNIALVCDITDPPAMKDYFAVFVALGDQALAMFPMGCN